MMGTFKIGYEQLTRPEKIVYEQFEKAFATCSAHIDGDDFDRAVDVMKVLQTVLGDNPHVIYFNKTQIRMSASLFGGKQYHLYGARSEAENKVMQKELQIAVESAIDEIELLNPISDYDKLMCVYEYLQDHVVYDERELEACSKYGKSQNPLSHNAYGALVKGTAVCDGIAAAFCLIAQRLGYSAMIVGGRATFRTTGFTDHAWSLIRVGTKFYHLDPTWDINHKCQTGDYSYDYFCVDDDDISTDHDWDIKTTPACNSQTLSFYFRNQCYANNLTQLEDIFRRYAKSKQSVVRVKISHGITIPEPADAYLGKKLLNVAGSVGRYGSVRYIFNKGIKCFYAKFVDRHN